MFEVLQFYVSSLHVWMGLTCGAYIILCGFAEVVKAFRKDRPDA